MKDRTVLSCFYLWLPKMNLFLIACLSLESENSDVIIFCVFSERGPERGDGGGTTTNDC